MYCIECGVRLPAKSKFCPVCGTPVRARGELETEIVQDESQNPSSPSKVTPSTQPRAKRCPNCALPNPVDASECRCGRRFQEGASQKTLEHTVVASTAIFTRKPEGNSSRPTSATPTVRLGAANVLGGVLGVALARYSGASLVIPLFGAVLAWPIATKVISGSAKHFVPAISVEAGHLLWFLAGLLAMGAAGIAQVGIDFVVMIGGILWLVVRPGIWPSGILVGWQGFGLLYNVFTLSTTEIGSIGHRALVVHISIRVVTLYLLATGISALRQ
jgi:hypothetical protein